MTVTSGTRLGPYEVISPVGAGGMGEVFKARDTRLERHVAIKILPADFAQNAQLRMRFEREAKTISQLSHPNICTLYDVGDGYLVMELLEGESLADRLAKGPLPMPDVLRIGAQIGDALDRAHKAGIVHRDLKPGNVMLTKSGAKLLDFGLAKEQGAFGGNVDATMQKPLTQEGALIGTFQYMAPEQLEGAPADARTDIFALGAVLYEMATGRRAFEGKSKASLIASILAAEPKPISAVLPMTPASFDRIVRKCLQKEPDERWQSAHDVATELRWIAETPAGEAAPRRAKRNTLAWSVAALLAITAAALGVITFRDRAAHRTAPIVRTSILPPDKTEFDFLGAGGPPAISPDGSRIVFGATEPGKPRMLYMRALDSIVAQPIAGTERASYPFWSPDGRTIAFFTESALKKIEAAGGAAVVLSNVLDGRGGSWSPDGQTIIFSGRFTPVYRIPAAGGTPVEVTKLEDRWPTHRWPEFLPDSRHFLYLASQNGNEEASNTIFVASLDGKLQKPVVGNTDEGRYLNGFVLFVRDGILHALRFDVKKLAPIGEPIPLKEQQLERTPLFSRSVFSVSPAGTLVYQSGAVDRLSQITWFDRTGKVLGTVGEPDQYNFVALAPDQKSVVASYVNRPQTNLWLFDLARNVKTRLTFGSGFETAPIWSPDGRKIIFSTIGPGSFQLILHDLTTGAEETLLKGTTAGNPAVTGWSRDGQRILFSMGGRTTRADIWWMSLADRKPQPLIVTPFIENGARFSPDGKWVAYQSNEGTGSDIYVAPFPPTGAKWQVSSGGGVAPRWRADGKELFYLVPGLNKLMTVPIALSSTPQIGQPVHLFDFHIAQPGLGVYDVTPDGQRILLNSRFGEVLPPQPMIVVQNFDRELRDALEHRE